jgi:RNA polymerase sigma factor (sigma-70 family)
MIAQPRPRTEARPPLPNGPTEDAPPARIRSADRSARDALVLANLGLAVELARRFRSAGMTMDDLLQEARLGLVHAADRYDPDAHRGRFSTYAAHWIRKYIHRALIANRSIVKMPEYIYKLQRKVERHRFAARDAADSGGEGGRAAPGPDELARELGISPRRAEYLDRASVRPIVTGADPDGRRGELEGIVADEDPPDRESERAEEIAAAAAALHCLTPFEAWVIRCRFGMEDRSEPSRAPRPSAAAEPIRDEDGEEHDEDTQGGAMSYPRIGASCGLGERRIRRVEYLAIRKLRAYLEPWIGQSPA